MGKDSKALRSLAVPLGALLSLAFAGCGGISFNVGGGGDPVARRSTPAPASPRPDKEEAAIRNALHFVESQKISYRISPAELLEITVYQEPDLDRQVRVSPDGTITLPLTGTVKVGGLSVADAEKAVRDKLNRFVINPQVSVFIKEYGNKQVYVLGQVKNPGSYPLPTEAPLTVIEAITLAGGFTDYASIDRTRVIRKGSGGVSQAFMIEVSAIMKHGDKSKDIELKTNDVIFVPERFF